MGLLQGQGRQTEDSYMLLLEASPMDSTVHYQLHLFSQALSASAQRPAQGECVRNREKGVWQFTSESRVASVVCVTMCMCVSEKGLIVSHSTFYSHPSLPETIAGYDSGEGCLEDTNNKKKKKKTKRKKYRKRKDNDEHKFKGNHLYIFYFSLWRLANIATLFFTN